MKKLRLVIPVVAFLIAIAGAFAGNSKTLVTDVTKYKPSSSCETCDATADTGCGTSGTFICKCGTADGYDNSCNLLRKN